MAGRGQEIASVIKRQIEEFGGELTMVDVGVVAEVGDGIARIHVLSGVASSELGEFEGGIRGRALNRGGGQRLVRLHSHTQPQGCKHTAGTCLCVSLAPYLHGGKLLNLVDKVRLSVVL